ncbi:MAG: glutathione S-transferase family protein, partial [Rubricella sp.]
MSYTLIGQAQSRAMRVLWMLEETGADYDHIPALPQSEGILAANPTGKIPALIVDDTPITDSVAICQFLADRHAVCTFEAGTVERARQDAHTQFIAEEIDGALWLAAKHRFVLPDGLKVPAVKETARAEFDTAMVRLAARLGDGPYLMGDTFTVPDIIGVHCIGWAKAARFEVRE